MIGVIRKMVSELADPVKYWLPIGEERFPISEYIGKSLQLNFSGNIHCLNCQRKTNKSFSQGYCYPCFKKLARCDLCIVKPETCHFAQGSCREPEWGEKNCNIDHIVYLANSSGVKVGITRHSQIPIRWIDQGASQAVPIFKVASRYHSGLVEVALAQAVADKTNWRAMLKGVAEPMDLLAEKEKLVEACASSIDELKAQLGEDALQALDIVPTEINYPVLEYPTKISSLNFDKSAKVGGKLMGIKGQYLIFDTGVINVRKFAAYEIELLH